MTRKHQTASPSDLAWMGYALRLAGKGVGHTSPNPPVGAVVVSRGRKAGEGWHRKAGTPHAEVIAIRQAGSKSRGATLYVTLEPCSTWGRTPPCTDIVMASGIRRVVVAVRDPNPRHRGRGIAILKNAGIRVVENVCAGEARALLAPFAKWVTTGLPFVTLKMGMSLDGRIADGTGRSRWITGPASRSAVRHLRRKVDAIVVGGNTARADNPSLLASVSGRHNPLRVVVSEQGVSSRLSVFRDQWAHRTILATSRSAAKHQDAGTLKNGARVWSIPAGRSGLSLRSLLRRLADDGCLHILCEGGGQMAASLLRESLVDRCLFFVAPIVLGGKGRNVVQGGGWVLGRTPELCFKKSETSGSDILIRAVPRGSVYGRWMRD